MLNNLIKLLATSVNKSLAQLGRDLKYKTSSAFQSVTSGKDIRLTVLLSICKACNCDIIITNHSTININLADYVAGQERKQD